MSAHDGSSWLPSAQYANVIVDIPVLVLGKFARSRGGIATKPPIQVSSVLAVPHGTTTGIRHCYHLMDFSLIHVTYPY